MYSPCKGIERAVTGNNGSVGHQQLAQKTSIDQCKAINAI